MGKFSPNILKTAAKGKHTEDGGLQLRITSVTEDGIRKGSWYFRYSFQGRQQEVGLGSISKLTLKQARLERDRYADGMADRRNPVNPKDAKRLEREQGQTKSFILSEVADLAFKARQGQLRGDGKAGRWMSPLTSHVLPKLGRKDVTQINQRDISNVLSPIWKEKAPTAKKAIERLGIVLRHARAMGLDVNPLVVDDAKALLGATGHVARHHPALPHAEVPVFFQSLDTTNIVQRLLAYYLLSGAGTRIRPVLNMRFDQIEGDVWTVPASMMKGLRDKAEDFRVPITKPMSELIDISRAETQGALVFPSPNRANKPESPISDQAVENVMRRSEDGCQWPEPYRLHGLRASFRTWVSVNNPSLYAVAETALAHKVGRVVERSYQRHDFLEERRRLLENWADFLSQADEASTPAELPQKGLTA